MKFFKKLFAFLHRDFINDTSYRVSFIMQIFGVFFSSVTFHFLSQLFGQNVNQHLEPYGGNYFAFVIIGIAFSGYLELSMQSFGNNIRTAQLTGTLEALLLTKTNIHLIIFCSSIYSFFWTSIRVLMLLLFGILVFDMNVTNANYPGAIIILFLTITSFMGVGIMSAGFIMVLKKGRPLNWIFTTLSMLLGGVYYPISVLPDWMQKCAHFFPITYALEGIRQSMLNGANFREIAPNLIALTAFTIIVLPASLWVFSIAVKKTKIDGSMTHY